jgi:hypothetical protein
MPWADQRPRFGSSSYRSIDFIRKSPLKFLYICDGMSKPSVESSLRRTVMLAVAIILVALLGMAASRMAVSSRGAVAPNLLLATRPALAVAAAIIAMIGAFLIALPLAKPVNAVVALFTLGCGVAAYAMLTGTVADLVFLNGSLLVAAIETLLWSALIAAGAIAMFRVGGPLPDVPATDPDAPFAREMLHQRALLSLLAGVAAVPVVIFTLVGPTKGQSIGACTMAGVAVAVVGRLIAPKAQPILLFAAPTFAIGAAQLVLALAAPGSVDAAFAAGALSPLRVPMPMDVAAGSLCGVAIGLGWSKGLVKKDADESPLSGR